MACSVTSFETALIHPLNIFAMFSCFRKLCGCFICLFFFFFPFPVCFSISDTLQ